MKISSLTRNRLPPLLIRNVAVTATGALSQRLPRYPQATPLPTPASWRERRLPPPRHLRLLLVALVVVLLAALAGGYGAFRALSPAPRHLTRQSSAFQRTRCPFPSRNWTGRGKNVICGFLVVPEDRSQPQGAAIRLAVAIFKASSPHPTPDPVLFLSGGPGDALLENAGPGYNARNLPRQIAT